MALPPIIEIVPLSAPVVATITVPGSKSITNRSLILAALGNGQVTLQGALWSEDTQVMVEALRVLGFDIDVQPDPQDVCNRHIGVKGLGGRIPKAGTVDQPLDLFVGNAGTAARFLAGLCCLGRGSYRLHGVPRMHQRPQAALFHALRELGYRVESASDHLPVVIHGQGPRAGATCTVSIEESSQFASALMLCAGVGEWKIAIDGENAEESPYVVMTHRLIEAFPAGGGKFQIEPDASSGSYVWAAGWLVSLLERATGVERSGDWQGSPVAVRNWPDTGWQIDAEFPDFLPLPPRISREDQLGDSIMTAIVLSADREAARGWEWTGTSPHTCFTDLARLRVQECERVLALRTELTKCGARVEEEGDTLTVFPAVLHGADIETYNDHRMAMCFAILGLKVPGIRLHNPACVKKTFPNFFQKLAARPPHGLGVAILDPETGRKLEGEELFAE